MPKFEAKKGDFAKTGGGGVKYTLSESSLQDLFKNECLVDVAVRVIKIFGTKDNRSATHMTKQGVG